MGPTVDLRSPAERWTTRVAVYFALLLLLPNPSAAQTFDVCTFFTCSNNCHGTNFDGSTVTCGWDSATNTCRVNQTTLPSELNRGACTPTTAPPSRSPSFPLTLTPTTRPPSTSPTSSPSAVPTESPTSAPTETPTHFPTAEPTNAPTGSPTAVPTVTPTAGPTTAPTVNPTASPTPVPSASPTATPSKSPSLTPTIFPTTSPSAAPTSVPSTSPTTLPTTSPSNAPTSMPSSSPTAVPSAGPTATPSAAPTIAPSAVPSTSPSAFPTAVPSTSPTSAPSTGPTASPTLVPTASPTTIPTAHPTTTPTAAPSAVPTALPTASPSAAPTVSPTGAPSTSPSAAPTTFPTTSTPTTAPIASPTATPSTPPTATPTNVPTLSPTNAPTTPPTLQPTAVPSATPSAGPTFLPTTAPTLSPTFEPSASPSRNPTATPTASPTQLPTALGVCFGAAEQNCRYNFAYRHCGWDHQVGCRSCHLSFGESFCIGLDCCTWNGTACGSATCTDNPTPTPTTPPPTSVPTTATPTEIPTVTPSSAPSDHPTSLAPTARPSPTPTGTPTTVAPSFRPTPRPSTTPTLAPSVAVCTSGDVGLPCHPNDPCATPGSGFCGAAGRGFSCYVSLVPLNTACFLLGIPGVCRRATTGAFACDTGQTAAPVTFPPTTPPTTGVPTSQSPTSAAPAPQPTPSPTPAPAESVTTRTQTTATATFIGIPGFALPGDLFITGSAVVDGTSMVTLRNSATMQRAFVTELQRLVATFLPIGKSIFGRVTFIIDVGNARRRSGNANVGFELRIPLGSPTEETALLGLLRSTRSFDIPPSINGFPATATATFCSSCFTSSSIATTPTASIDEPIDVQSNVSTSSDDGGMSSTMLALLVVVILLILAVVIGGVVYAQRKRAESTELHKGAAAPTYLNYVKNDVFDDSVVQEHSDKRRVAYAGTPLATMDGFSASNLHFNANKNRFADRVPYNQTRVFLAHESGTSGADYINASFVDLHGDSHKYIATQGPLRNTVADFWQMVMQQDTVAIVMLSTAASDSVKYWPDGGSERYGSITVSSQSEVVHPGFLVRYLVVSTESTSREVMHFQYLNWPDEHSGEAIDTPSLLSFRREVMLHEDPSVATVVHCSNGCGRTGVYICADSELKHFGSKSTADLHESVAASRRSRPLMVESPLQYAYLHTVVLDAVLHEPAMAADGVVGDAADLIKGFYVPEDAKAAYGGFDLGRPGRTIVRVGTFGLASSKRARMATVGERTSIKVVICTDVVIVCKVFPGGAFALNSVSPRSAVSIAPTGALGLVLKTNKEYGLQCLSTEERKLWMRSLSSLTGYTPTNTLTGKRMATLQPKFRHEALQILTIQDPQTESGLVNLKAEFSAIPKAFKKEIGAWHALNGDRKNILPPDTSYLSVMPNSSIFMYPGNDSQHAQASDRSGRM